MSKDCFTTYYQPELEDTLPDDYFDRFPDRIASRRIDAYYRNLAASQKDGWLANMAEAAAKAETTEELRQVITDLLCWIREYVVTEVIV